MSALSIELPDELADTSQALPAPETYPVQTDLLRYTERISELQSLLNAVRVAS